jgi:hypothetical protein
MSSWWIPTFLSFIPFMPFALSEIDHGIVPARSITDDGFPSSLIEESRR